MQPLHTFEGSRSILLNLFVLSGMKYNEIMSKSAAVKNAVENVKFVSRHVKR